MQWGENFTAVLVSQSLLKAVTIKKLEKGLLHHSDRGNHCYNYEYRKLLDEYVIKSSVSRK